MREGEEERWRGGQEEDDSSDGIDNRNRQHRKPLRKGDPI